MDTLPCGHVANAGTNGMCQHLVDAVGTGGREYIRLLTGQGVEADLCCRACDKARDGGAPAIDRSVWLILIDDGRLVRFDADVGTCERVVTTTVPEEPDHQPWAGHTLRRRLHLAADGRFAAVVNDFGRHGQVIDLVTSEVTGTLDGGDYHHETAWNRLDISDPASGQSLAPRQQSSYRQGEPEPEHYLDYFHGALCASPSGRWLADDGWVWHPVGIPVVWDLHRWLTANVWESEDGPTRRELCYRDYHWNAPVCWIGDNLVASARTTVHDGELLRWRINGHRSAIGYG